jgi:deoxycytidylate deaminase
MNSKNKKKIDYPYLPKDRVINYVPENNQYMKKARSYSLLESQDDNFKTGSVIVKDNKIIGLGANGSDYHKTHQCERIKQNIPTGQDYELCEGCHPKNHSEPTAIRDAKEKNNDINGADLYLWGHWWCCESCWNAMMQTNIKNVYLLEDSEKIFNKEHPENIIGQY